MSLFEKLFHKNKNDQPEQEKYTEQNAQTQDGKSFETPLGKFNYVYAPNCVPPEFGYESDIQWYDVPEDEEALAEYFPVGCYIDCNTADTKDAGICLDRLTRLFEDRIWTDRRVKQAVANYFAGEDGMIKAGGGQDISKDEFVADLEIVFISLHRDGTTFYTVTIGSDIDFDGEIHVAYDDKDQVTFQTDEEFYGS